MSSNAFNQLERDYNHDQAYREQVALERQAKPRGTRLLINPNSEAAWKALRVDDVTSTESSALFGMSPYCTAFELWHRKKDATQVDIPDNERMAWGRRLQDAIAYGVAEDKGWVCEPMKEYIRYIDGELRLGSSFDFKMIDERNRIGILEIKNVDFLVFRDKWTVHDDGFIEAPAHIEIQLQHQLHVADYEWGAIAVLVGGNKPYILVRERDHAVGMAIENRVRKFWKSIAENNPPPFELPADAEFISTLYGYAEPGKVLDAQGDEEIATLVKQYQEASQKAKLADEDKKTAKALLLTKIGSHEKVLGSGFTISAGMVGPAEVSYVREGYRNFRITTKKESKA